MIATSTTIERAKTLERDQPSAADAASRSDHCRDDPVDVVTQGDACLQRGNLSTDAAAVEPGNGSDETPRSAQAAELQSLLNAVLESTVDCVKVLRADATLEQMNGPGLCAMELDSFALVRDRVWFDLWPEESRRGLRAAFERAAAGEVARFEGYCPTAKGADRWWDVVITPIREDGGHVERLLSVSRDISRSYLAAREEEQARQQAEDASRAKSAFLANISHEIRSPLAAILGYADLLETQAAEDRRRIEIIRHNGRYLQELVSDVIDLSRIEAGQVQIESIAFSPLRLVDEVLSLMSVRAYEAKLELESDFVGLLPQQIVADPLRTRQILVNLVANAVKFTDEGSVTVRLSFDRPEEDHAEAVGRLKFAVVDTGIGMTPQQQAQVFAAFTQADVSTTRKYGGSGLGLTISRQLATLLGGELSVVSQCEEGSTFTLTLPVPMRGVTLTRDHAPSSAARPSQPPQRQRLPVNVLVVDDRPDMRFMTRALLERAGGSVQTAGSGAEAIEIIASLPRADAFDAVLMDVQMPGMDGLGTTRRLREDGCQLPIIALTANAMAEDRRQCLTAGFTDYLSKPVDFSELVACLRKHTGGSAAACRRDSESAGPEAASED